MNNSNTFIAKLRDSGLRPTKQRIKICQLLFKSKKTFHFTINDLAILIKKNLTQKVSLATIYNTVHAFKKKGYLKEISINSEKTYFDTNTSNHHHFIDESTNEIVDLKDDEVEKIKINKNLRGKKVKSIEVLVKVENRK